MPPSWVGPPHDASSKIAAATIVVNSRFMSQTPEGAHGCSLGALISLAGDTRRHPDGSRTSSRAHSRSAWPRARSTRRPLARGMPGPPGRESCGTPAMRSPAHDRKSTRLNSSHSQISYAVFCLKKNAARLGEVGEDARHLLGRLDVELLRREAEAARVLKVRAGLDAEEGFVGPGMTGLEIVRVVRADHRRADGAGDPERLGHDPRLLVEPVGLDLHEVVVLAEDLLIPAGSLSGPQRIGGAQESRDLGVQAPGEDEQPVGMLREELPIHAGLVIEALQVR